MKNINNNNDTKLKSKTIIKITATTIKEDNIIKGIKIKITNPTITAKENMIKVSLDKEKKLILTRLSQSFQKKKIF